MATDSPSGQGFDHDAILERSANLTWELTSRIIDHVSHPTQKKRFEH